MGTNTYVQNEIAFSRLKISKGKKDKRNHIMNFHWDHCVRYLQVNFKGKTLTDKKRNAINKSVF